MLTDDEKEAMREWARGDELYGDFEGSLFEAVESIITDREREAARRALLDFRDSVHASIPATTILMHPPLVSVLKRLTVLAERMEGDSDERR
jgi:hypothetical protein